MFKNHMILRHGNPSNTIILEDRSNVEVIPFSIILEQAPIDNFKGDGTTTAFTLTESSAATDTLTVYVNDVKILATNP